MKKMLFSVLLLFFIVLQGCKKDNVGQTSLSGRWKLVSSTGGFTGVTVTYGPGSAHILQLRNDSTYLLTLNNSEYETGKYSLSIINSNNIKTVFISFKNGINTVRQILQLQNDKLVLDDNAADGFEYLYKRAVL